jgi:hypothetical protein
MSATPPSSPERRRLWWVAAYYVVLAAVLTILTRLFPEAMQTLGSGRLEALAATDVFNAAPVGEAVADTVIPGVGLATVSMFGALVIMVPITWVYMVTRGYRGYTESVLHTLLILPVAVTGIVMVVQHSVALAFSLAGIVAAVRFRTTLEDTKDAVYVFLAIGVGLASGIQALGIALALSLVFNGVVLVLWRTRFGNPYAGQGLGRGGMTRGEAQVGPDRAETVQIVPHSALLDAAAPADIGEALDRAAWLERHIAVERRKRKGERANAVLLVHARNASEARSLVEPLLEGLTTRHKAVEDLMTASGRVILAYLMRLDEPWAGDQILDGLAPASGGSVEAAELLSLKGLKKRS